MKKKDIIVGYSGGKDSTAMLLLLSRDKRYNIVDVLHFDGGWDFPQIRVHNKKVEKITGLKITKIKPKKNFDYWLYKHKGKGNKIGRGWPNLINRWCMTLKGQTIDKYKKEKALLEIPIAVGLAFDEYKRSLQPTYKKINAIFPLIENKMTEKQALKFCYSNGLDFGGIYNHFNRIGCFCCPLQPLYVNSRIFLYYPKLWNEMLKKDKKIKNRIRGYYYSQKTRKYYSVQELDVLFKKEKRNSIFF